MTPKPDAKKGEGAVLSRKRWKMALAMQRNANVPSEEANEDAAALDAHDLALRAKLAAAEARAEKAERERDEARAEKKRWFGVYEAQLKTCEQHAFDISLERSKTNDERARAERAEGDVLLQAAQCVEYFKEVKDLRAKLARAVEALKNAPKRACSCAPVSGCMRAAWEEGASQLIDETLLAEHDNKSTNGAASVPGYATGTGHSTGGQDPTPLVEPSPPAPEAAGKCMCGALWMDPGVHTYTTQDGDVHRQSAPCYVRSAKLVPPKTESAKVRLGGTTGNFPVQEPSKVELVAALRKHRDIYERFRVNGDEGDWRAVLSLWREAAHEFDKILARCSEVK